MSAMLNKKRAEEAVGHVMVAVRQMMDDKVLQRHDLAIVVLDPAQPPPGLGKFEDVILYEGFFGDHPDKWKKRYDKLARSKARLTWLHRMPSRVIQHSAPHLLVATDTVWSGSVILDGIVVGVSGVQPHFDEMIAMWVAAACKAVCIELREQKIDGKGVDFVEDAIGLELHERMMTALKKDFGPDPDQQT